jgi:hypothetical protein
MAMACTLEVLNADGHLTLNWDPDNPDEVQKAKAEFEALKAAGFAFFREDREVRRLGRSGALDVKAGEAPPVAKAREFEPRAARTVAVRPMRGG